METIVAAERDGREPGEADWILAAQAGDRSSFEKLYRRHAGRVYGLCLRLTGRADAAEELTQEAFVRTWQHRGKLDPEQGAGGWLHRVAVNLHLNGLRRKAHRGDPAPLPADDCLDGSVRPPWDGAARDLEGAIATLPDAARTVYVLHEIHGYRHHEIAERMGIAVGTSKAHVHRARLRLKRILGR